MSPDCFVSDPELAVIGMNEKEAREAGVEYAARTDNFAEVLFQKVRKGLKLIFGLKGRSCGKEV